MKPKIMYLCIQFLIFGLVLTSCYRSTPPDLVAVQDRFDNNFDAIQEVIDFMKNSEHRNIYITESDGTMNADLYEISITDPSVVDAINQLLESKNYYKICKIDNTIYLLQWKGLHDIGCGIAYTINETDPPEIPYATTLLPLACDGWFYYVSDYELWKNNYPNLRTSG